MWAVVSLPSGIFQPYAGVSTNILFLDKKIAKERDSILFCKLENDGYSLSTKRTKIEGNEIPELTNIILKYKQNGLIEEKNNLFLVKKSVILKDLNVDLSVNKYRSEDNNNIEEVEPVIEIVKRIIERNKEYNDLIKQLEEIKWKKSN